MTTDKPFFIVRAVTAVRLLKVARQNIPWQFLGTRLPLLNVPQPRIYSKGEFSLLCSALAIARYAYLS
jgi:hypothetical protein